MRSTLVGVITGLVVASFTAPIPVALLIALVVPALALDAVDGWVARRTGTSTELGARFDMEVDAFLLLVLSAYVAQTMGRWVLAIGLMRYAFVAVGWVLPWFRAGSPSALLAQGGDGRRRASRWRSRPPASSPASTRRSSGLALALLVESFGRDVVWLIRRRNAPVVARSSAEADRVE